MTHLIAFLSGVGIVLIGQHLSRKFDDYENHPYSDYDE